MIEQFTAQEWLKKTAWPLRSGGQFAWTRYANGSDQFVYEWDIPMTTFRKDDPTVTLMVYSSINPTTGATDPEAGEDSIRVVVKISNGSVQSIYKWPGKFWICRTPGWEERLRIRIADHVSQLKTWKKRCSKCGGMIYPCAAKSGRWYMKCFGVGGYCGRTYVGRDDKRPHDHRFKGWCD